MENKENGIKCGEVPKVMVEDSQVPELERKVSFIRESVSDGGVPPRKLSVAVETAKRTSLHSRDADSASLNQVDSPKVPRKFVTTWRQACDRTKDKTKELLKRWKTLPEGNAEMIFQESNNASEKPTVSTDNPHNWSIHVWASYIKRYPSDDENLLLPEEDKENAPILSTLSSTQKEKLGHFFSHVLDNDHDDLISEQDFEHFSEKLRRFADWSTNSPEYLIMVQVQHGFVSTFLSNNASDSAKELPKTERWKQYIGLDEWFQSWATLLLKTYSFQDFPIWLQYLPKLLFQAINRSGSGGITRDELGSFYSSMLGFSAQRVGEILDEAYKSLTSNGDHSINYSVYRLAFCNLLLGRHPNGPGQYLFGCMGTKIGCFPIDYSALNTPPEDREHYTPDKRSNRVSVVI